MGMIFRNDRFDEFRRKFRRATAAGLISAANFYHARCRQAVSIPNTGVRKKRQRNTVAGKKGSTYTVYSNPSQPNEPPRKRKGTGHRHVVKEYNDNRFDPRVRIGVSKPGIHMAWLEVGTRRVLPRPWLLATLMKFWRVISALAATGGKRHLK